MEGYYIVRNKDIDVKYDENGFFQTEVLFPEGRNGMQPGTVSG